MRRSKPGKARKRKILRIRNDHIYYLRLLKAVLRAEKPQTERSQ